MKVLCLVSVCPMPSQSAEDERLLSFLEVWSSMASLDVIVRGTTTESQRTRLHDHLGGATVLGLPEADTPAGRLARLAHNTVSLDAARIDPGPARRRTRHFAQHVQRHDAVFAGDPFMAWLLRSSLPPVPWFLDIPIVHGPSPWGLPVTSTRDLIHRLRDRSIREQLATDRAARFELREAGIAHVTTVRTDADRESLGSPTTLVLSDGAVARDYWAVVRRTIAAAGHYASKGWT